MNDLLRRIIDENYVPTEEEAAEIAARWPACVVADVARLNVGNPTPADRRRIALRVGDEKAGMRLLGPDGTRFDNFYPDPRHDTPSTEATIDTFLGKFAGSGPDPKAIEDSIFPDSNMTSEVTASEEYDIEGESSAHAPEEEPELPCTEESALEMVKKRKYNRALEIIQALSLNNPEKSVYFADQIRFLRKLIINENNKQ